MTVDMTIHFSDIITMAGVLGTAGWMFISFRDVIRDHSREIKGLREDVDDVCDRQDRHHEWLIRSGADRRVIGNRRDNRHHETT